MSFNMNPEWKQKWIDALRSGDYKQAKHTMCHQRFDAHNTKDNSYCCLGVLRHIATGVETKEDADALGVDYDDSILTKEEEKVFNLFDDETAVLVCMNDDENCSFDTISHYIEGNL